MAAFCPHCGYDLERDKPIEIGRLSFDPSGPVEWAGHRLQLTVSEKLVLGTLAKMAGRPVSIETLHSRLAYEGEYRLGATFVCRIRSKIRDVDPTSDPIKCLWGQGYMLEAA